MEILLFYISTNSKVLDFINYLEDEIYILGYKSIKVPIEIDQIKTINYSEGSIAISIGGDGTVLYVARLLANTNIPIFPVNFGNLGFITEIKKNELIHILKSFIENKIETQKRIVIKSDIISNNEIKTYKALNDIVITRSNVCKIIDLDLYINQEYVCRYRADGLIIATPTGSTAYSLSAGGPILEPELENIIITPICPHSLRVRPLVIDASKEIQIRVISNTPQIITFDGQITFEITNKDLITIKKDGYVNIVKPENRSFFNVLKEKLNWLD
ncbi:MAG TPA: NAD(+)/NADH kinase [Spirochaetota bacterium]|nr:NAD(+)/NADH kinase [Spirochaetota bacterium]HOM39255.1 NAD(+)/NADH kinase [Spirochaetota bacterium]HPQ49256.1 NAD(+)/NADH kinase [Spirochaetota bacterium]